MIELSKVKKILDQVDKIYTSDEAVAALFEFCSAAGWPKIELSQILVDFDQSSKTEAKESATACLAGIGEDGEGFRLGYITPEAGDFDRMMAAPLIPRKFIETLAKIDTDA